MAGTFSDAQAASPPQGVAPPPTAPEQRADTPPKGSAIQPVAASMVPDRAPEKGRSFDAELDICELTDRLRPGQAWAARAKELSRAHLVFRSRRMCYATRQLLIKVHLIDAKPVGLFGQVRACQYDGEGLYRVEVDLLPVPPDVDAAAWFASS